MAVKTSPFAGWRLSGRDAEVFATQVDESRPNQKAQDALKRGRALSQKMSTEGYSSVKAKKVTLLNRIARCFKPSSK